MLMPRISVLWSNPQWQIDAVRRFQILDQLVEGYDYPQLTDEVKQKVLGQNAAQLWGLKTASYTTPDAHPQGFRYNTCHTGDGRSCNHLSPAQQRFLNPGGRYALT